MCISSIHFSFLTVCMVGEQRDKNWERCWNWRRHSRSRTTYILWKVEQKDKSLFQLQMANIHISHEIEINLFWIFSKGRSHIIWTLSLCPLSLSPFLFMCVCICLCVHVWTSTSTHMYIYMHTVWYLSLQKDKHKYKQVCIDIWKPILYILNLTYNSKTEIIQL